MEEQDDNSIKTNKKKDYKRCIDNSTENMVETIPKKKRAKTEKRPLHHIRYGNSIHTQENTENRKRCKMEKCIFKSYIKCSECDVHLCANKRTCFNDFHSINRN